MPHYEACALLLSTHLGRRGLQLRHLKLSRCGTLLQEPEARLATVAAAGAERVPFTTGLLIGIGEARTERLDTLFAIRDLHAAYGHIQVHPPSAARFVWNQKISPHHTFVLCITQSRKAGPHCVNALPLMTLMPCVCDGGCNLLTPLISHTVCRSCDTTLWTVDRAKTAAQEVIVQNFRAKPGTAMADAPEPPLSELLWTVAVARLILGPAMSIQARRRSRHTVFSLQLALATHDG